MSKVVSQNPDILGGEPVFVGTRVPVKSLFDHLEAGDSIEEFLEGFPSVKREQVIALLEEAREHALAAIDELAPAAAGGAAALAEHERTAAFAVVRALAVEAYYSDFVAPGSEGPGAWAEIDFNSPLATRLAKDWSFLGIA